VTTSKPSSIPRRPFNSRILYSSGHTKAKARGIPPTQEKGDRKRVCKTATKRGAAVLARAGHYSRDMIGSPSS